MAELSDVELVRQVVALETRIIRDVSLVTGDKDFPETWREEIQQAITKCALDYEAYIHRDDKHPWRPWDMCDDKHPWGPWYDVRVLPLHDEARKWLLTIRHSRLIGVLHSLFHRVASERIPHRFGGWFGDNPADVREEQDNPRTCKEVL